MVLFLILYCFYIHIKVRFSLNLVLKFKVRILFATYQRNPVQWCKSHQLRNWCHYQCPDNRCLDGCYCPSPQNFQRSYVESVSCQASHNHNNCLRSKRVLTVFKTQLDSIWQSPLIKNGARYDRTLQYIPAYDNQ